MALLAQNPPAGEAQLGAIKRLEAALLVVREGLHKAVVCTYQAVDPEALQLRVHEPKVGDTGMRVEPRFANAIVQARARRHHLADPVGYDGYLVRAGKLRHAGATPVPQIRHQHVAV